MTIHPAIGAAALMGLFGSLHCAGMCGPLAVAGCAGPRRAKDAFAYLFGRMIAYATGGAVVGQLGHHALCMLPVETTGHVVVALMAGPAAFRGVQLLRARSGAQAPLKLRRAPRRAALSWIASLLPRRGLGLGLATGLLPCGLLLSGLALAASTTDPSTGALVMVSLSVATLPGLIGPIAGGRLLVNLSRRLSLRQTGLLWCALALWLAMRPAFVREHCPAPPPPIALSAASSP